MCFVFALVACCSVLWIFFCCNQCEGQCGADGCHVGPERRVGCESERSVHIAGQFCSGLKRTGGAVVFGFCFCWCQTQHPRSTLASQEQHGLQDRSLGTSDCVFAVFMAQVRKSRLPPLQQCVSCWFHSYFRTCSHRCSVLARFCIGLTQTGQTCHVRFSDD